MKILIAGGQGFTDKAMMQEALSDYEDKVTCVISGRAKGADTLGEQWGSSVGALTDPYPALWEKYGRAAGPIRNQQMLDEGQPDLVVVFPGGPGSKSMVRKARKAGVDVMTPGWVVT